MPLRAAAHRNKPNAAASTAAAKQPTEQQTATLTVMAIPSAEERSRWYAMEPVAMPRFIGFLCKHVKIYETISILLLIMYLGLFPYDTFFNVNDPQTATLVYALDILYAVDIILRLIVEEWRHRNKARCLVFMFPYRPIYCLVDIISVSPFYYVPLLITPKEELTFTDLGSIEWYQVPTLCRVYRVALYFGELEANGLLYETIIFVLKFTFGYLAFILAVSVAYFWFTHLEELEYFLLTRNRDLLKTTWAADFLNAEMIDTPIGFFLLTTNFATVVVTTVGYGDIAPSTEGEMFGSIGFMLIGAIFLSGYFQSQITSFCLQLDGARLDLFHRLDGIKISLKNANMGEFFIAKVEQYYKCLWTYREGVDRVLFMQLLPHSFQEDISYDICLEMFSKSYLFRGLDEAFLRSVSKIVTIALYNPGMIVCRYGGYANKMYYIIQGECQAMSKHDTAKKAAILRAGSIIGETNLFFSSPYTISVETRNCCQLMCLDKEELMRIFNKFQNELNILRSRCQAKINDMYYYYEKKGEDPVCWVEIRPDAHAQFINKSKMMGGQKVKRTRLASKSDTRNPEWPVCTMRWGYGFNDLITEDVILDAEEFVIFDYPCEDKLARKNHVTPYMTCVVPEILSSEITFIHVWNIGILICSLLYGFYAPYCLAFNTSSLIEFYVCKAGSVVEYFNDVIYILDVFVEILGGAPVEGLFYKFRDGLNTKKNSFVFYLDVVSALPLSFFQHYNERIKQINVIIKSAKIWKAIRYLNYMDNVHPKHVFWFRLMQTCLVIVYGIHFIACTVFIQACDLITEEDANNVKARSIDNSATNGERDCTKDVNWLWSYIKRAESDVVEDSITVKSLSTKNPYLVSFYYASATLTSAGFGDFSPQNPLEMTWAIVFTLIGFFLICYYTSVLTSALSCIVKPRLEFQQKLVAVRRFMEYYRLPDGLQRRVVQYYELQHQVRHGINLPHGIEHFLFDAPDYLRNDYLYTENVVLFDGVPLFSKVEPKYITKMADVMRRYLIPPNVMFLHRGEVRRAMYLVASGSCGVYDEKHHEPKYILEATSHFGIRDLLFGEPSHFTIRTLSYCYMYEITYEQVVEVFEEDAELLDLIEDEKDVRHEEIEDMYNQYSKLEREQHADAYIEIPSWIHFRPTKDNRGRQGRRYLEYDRFFDEFRCGKFLRWFLEKGTVHPVGKFAKWWSCWMSLVSCMTLMLLFMETFMYLRTPTMRLCQWILDTFFYVDIYIKLHWGYYQPKTGLLISHPLKTAGVYIFEGSFFTDVIFCTPLELATFVYGSTGILGYGHGATWYTKFRWIRFLQIKRIPQIFSIVHNIFVQRTAILFFLFVTLTLVVCSIVGSVSLYIACPWEANDWKPGDEYRLPACSTDRWANRKFDGVYAVTEAVLADVMNRWIFGLYYVSQVLLVIGFGDMITLNPSELLLLIFMSVFGFVFMRCVIADMTAAEVDSDEIRARYTDAMKTLIGVMQKEKINRKLTETVHDHLNNMWKRSKGLQPGRLFNDLHPSLESDVFRSYVGETLRKVAVFKDFTPNVLRTLCLYLKKLHFLKGERLMKFGNLEYEMYIIVSGKVWITDKRLSYGCTLGRYETVGESSMLSFGPRRYSAIAATSVETFCISRKDFDALIERYPKVRDILSALLRNGDYDYFEYKIYEMIDRLKELNGDERDRQIDLLQARTNEIKGVVSNKENLDEEEAGDWIKASAKNLFVHFMKRIISSGSDDDGLPFFYFVGRRNRSNGKYSIFPPLIHPNCAFIKFYFTIVFCLCLLCPALAMFEYCMSDNLLTKLAGDKNYEADNDDEKILHNIHLFANYCEYFLLSFIIVNLITPYQNEHGLYVKDFWSIVFNYAFAYDGMWLDIVASIPLTVSGFDYSPRLLLATRTLRLYRYYSFYMKKRDDLSVSPFRLKIQLSVSSFILMAHYIACIFYSISSCHDEDVLKDDPCKQIDYTDPKNLKAIDPTYTWTYKFVQDRNIRSNEEEQMHRWKWWLRSLYWVVTVVSTTGFGDIVPQNTAEMVVGIICFFAGAFILSIILSSFTAGMTSITKAHREYLYQVKLLLKYLNNVGLSPIRLWQANLYFNVLWDKCRGRMYHEVTAILPTTMRIEVCNALYIDVLSKVLIFNINNLTFLRQVAARVIHSIYLPGVCIVKEGDLGNSLFIVFRGQVSGIVANETAATELKKVYLVADVFGKLPCLFHNEYYRKSYRAEVVTEVLELHSRDVLHLAALYPDFWAMLKAIVATNYNPNGESDCIFSPQRARKKNIYDLGEDYQQQGKEDGRKKKHVVHHEASADSHPNPESKDKMAPRQSSESVMPATGAPATPDDGLTKEDLEEEPEQAPVKKTVKVTKAPAKQAPSKHGPAKPAPKAAAKPPPDTVNKPLPKVAPVKSGLFTAAVPKTTSSRSNTSSKKKPKTAKVEDPIQFMYSSKRLSRLKEKLQGNKPLARSKSPAAGTDPFETKPASPLVKPRKSKIGIKKHPTSPHPHPHAAPSAKSSAGHDDGKARKSLVGHGAPHTVKSTTPHHPVKGKKDGGPAAAKAKKD